MTFEDRIRRAGESQRAKASAAAHESELRAQMQARFDEEVLDLVAKFVEVARRERIPTQGLEYSPPPSCSAIHFGIMNVGVSKRVRGWVVRPYRFRQHYGFQIGEDGHLYTWAEDSKFFRGSAPIRARGNIYKFDDEDYGNGQLEGVLAGYLAREIGARRGR